MRAGILSLICLENNPLRIQQRLYQTTKNVYLFVFYRGFIKKEKNPSSAQRMGFPQGGNFVSVFRNLASQRLCLLSSVYTTTAERISLSVHSTASMQNGALCYRQRFGMDVADKVGLTI